MTQQASSTRESSADTRPNPNAAKNTVRMNIHRSMHNNIHGFVKAAAVDTSMDLLKGAVGGTTGFMALAAVPAVMAVEFVIEQGMASADSETHKKLMLEAFDNLTAMYDALKRDPHAKHDPRIVEKYLRRISILKAIYTGDATYIRGVDKSPKFVKKGAQWVFDIAKGRMAKLAAKGIKELVDVVPLVNAGTVDEVVHMVVNMQLAKIYNEHPNVAENEQVHYSWRMLKGSIGDSWKQTVAYIKGIKAKDVLDLMTGKK